MARSMATSWRGHLDDRAQDARCRGRFCSQRQRDSTHFGWSASQSEAYCWPWTRQEVKDICSKDGLSSWQEEGDESRQKTLQLSHSLPHHA